MTPHPYIVPGLAVLPPPTAKKYTCQHVFNCVLTAFDLEGADLRKSNRETHTVVARHTYHWLARRYSVSSLANIGCLSLRDHSTVLHSARISPDLYKQNYKGYREYMRLAEAYVIDSRRPASGVDPLPSVKGNQIAKHKGEHNMT